MEYPNLELMAYKAELILQNNSNFRESFEKETKDYLFKMRPDFEVFVFPQVWGTTALGFDFPGTMAGQAFTRAYTTVVHECVTDTYVVFFGGTMAYYVTNATETFYEDLRNQNMKSVGQARDVY